MSGKVWKAGIVGLGKMANGHIRNLLSIDRTAVAAICDVNASALESKGKELGLPEHAVRTGVPIYIKSMLDRQEIGRIRHFA